MDTVSPVSQPIKYLKSFVYKGDARTVNTKKQIIGLAFLKGSIGLIHVLLISLAINFINPVQFGIWLTLSAIIGWINFFDIGLGNGLRNKFAEAKAKGQNELARAYVSTTYAGLILIICGISIVFFVANHFLDWTSILNAPPSMKAELHTLITLVFILFCLQFIFQLINTLFLADQKPVLSSLYTFCGELVILIVIFILSKVTEGKIIYLGLVISGIPVFILILTSAWYYRHDYKKYRPSIKYVRKEYFRDLLGLGVKFFILQIGSLVLFQVSNILIAHWYGPTEVTSYNIAFKYFSLITMSFSLINIPLWSAFTEAYVQGDLIWIKGVFRKLIKIWVVFAILSLLLFVVSKYAYKIWVPTVHVNRLLSGINCVYTIILTWNAIYFSFVNGIGKIKLQFYLMLLIIVIFLPLTTLFGEYLNLKSTGIILAMVVCQSIFLIVIPVQCYKIIQGKAKGIWNA